MTDPFLSNRIYERSNVNIPEYFSALIHHETDSLYNDKIRSSSFLGAAAGGGLSSESYAGFLRAYSAVYTVLASSAVPALHEDLFSLRYRLLPNPAGGRYPVTQDREELPAVLRASDYLMVVYPYYSYRYSLAGFLFSESDGGWLAALTEMGLPSVEKQVRWLAGLPSVRGMPTFLLAESLRVLHRELLQARPEKRELWDLLLRTAEGLDPREPGFPADDVVSRIPRLCHTAGLSGTFAGREAAVLVVRALLDVRSGYPGGAEGVIGWFPDPERFPESWASAARTLEVSAGSLIEFLAAEVGGRRDV